MMDYWIFTFGCGKDVYGDKAGTAVKVYANSYGEAPEKMRAKYGIKWAFQYSADEWQEMKERLDRCRLWEQEPITEEIE